MGLEDSDAPAEEISQQYMDEVEAVVRVWGASVVLCENTKGAV
jgi:hypothetical protein